jgi:hypothetical protein
MRLLFRGTSALEIIWECVFKLQAIHAALFPVLLNLYLLLLFFISSRPFRFCGPGEARAV